MIRDFWIALESHDWRHDPSNSWKRALLIYQGRVWRDWHKTLGMLDTFHLLPLNMECLYKYHQEALDNVYEAKINAIQMVRTPKSTSHIPTHQSYTTPTPSVFLPNLPPPLFLLCLILPMPIPALHADCVWDAGDICLALSCPNMSFSTVCCYFA